MNMILVSSNLQKAHFVPLCNRQAHFLDHSINILVKNRPPVFRSKNQMVEQNRDIVALVDVLAHRSTIQYAASGGELNPEEINEQPQWQAEQPQITP